MKALFLFLATICLYGADAQDFTLYQKKLLINHSDTLRYRILYPDNYQPTKVYPVVIFLHGAGERGDDNEHQLDLGAALFLKDSVRRGFPSIVIFPQCPFDSTWNRFTRKSDTTDEYYRSLDTSLPTTPERLVKRLLDSLMDSHIADRRRIYIGGLSLGGFGTYDLLIHYPNYFAAAFSICGNANFKLYTAKASHIPLWIFHGQIDNVIPVQPNRDLYRLLKEKGAKNVRYTEYPGVTHNSWINAFAEPQLLPWLFSFRK